MGLWPAAWLSLVSVLSQVRGGIWESATPQTACSCFWLLIQDDLQFWTGDKLEWENCPLIRLVPSGSLLDFLWVSPNSPIRQLEWLPNQEVRHRCSWNRVRMYVPGERVCVIWLPFFGNRERRYRSVCMCEWVRERDTESVKEREELCIRVDDGCCISLETWIADTQTHNNVY